MQCKLMQNTVLSRKTEDWHRKYRQEFDLTPPTAQDRAFVAEARQGTREIRNKKDDVGLLTRVWEFDVLIALEDGPVSAEKEESLLRYLDDLPFVDREVVNEKGLYSSLIKAAIVREVADGNVNPGRHRMPEPANMPYLLKPAEKLLWMLGDVHHSQEIDSESEFVSVENSGYLAPSAFDGRGVWKSHDAQAVEPGCFGFSNERIQFNGCNDNLCITYESVTALAPHEDGLVMRLNNQQVHSFVTGDGWFAYNLVANLVKHVGRVTG